MVNFWSTPKNDMCNQTSTFEAYKVFQMKQTSSIPICRLLTSSFMLLISDLSITFSARRAPIVVSEVFDSSLMQPKLANTCADS